MPPKIIKKSTVSVKEVTDLVQNTNMISDMSTRFETYKIGSEQMFVHFLDKFRMIGSVSRTSNELLGFTDPKLYLSYFKLILDNQLFQEYEAIKDDPEKKVRFENYIKEMFIIYERAVDLLYNKSASSELSRKYPSLRDFFKPKINEICTKNALPEFIMDEYIKLRNIITTSEESSSTNRFNTSRSSGIQLTTNKIEENINNADTNGYLKGIMPLRSEGIEKFVEYCKTIGKKLDTGSLLLTVEEMLEIYISGLSFFLNKYFPPADKANKTDNTFSVSNKPCLDFGKLFSGESLNDSIAFLKYVFINLDQNRSYEFTGQDKKSANFKKFKNYLWLENPIVKLEDLQSLDLFRDNEEFKESTFKYRSAYNTLIIGGKIVEPESGLFAVVLGDKEFKIDPKLLNYFRQVENVMIQQQKDEAKKNKNREIIQMILSGCSFEVNEDNVRLMTMRTFFENLETFKEILKDDRLVLISILKGNTIIKHEDSFDIELNGKIYNFSHRFKDMFYMLENEIVSNESLRLQLIAYIESLEDMELTIKDRIPLFFEFLDKNKELLVTILEGTNFTINNIGKNDEIIVDSKRHQYQKRYLDILRIITTEDEFRKELLIYVRNSDQNGISLIVNEEKLNHSFALAITRMFILPVGNHRHRESRYNVITLRGISDNFKLYWWQKVALEYALRDESFFIWGVTSGGKTHILMLIIIAVITNYRDISFVYCAPTDQLAIQTYANIICTIGRDKVSIISECVTYISPNSSIFVGTPKELSDYFTKYNMTSIYNSSKPSYERIEGAIEGRKMSKIFRLAVDEVHVMDKTYNATIEGRKAAKSIYDLITGLKDVSDKVQIMAMSASLSDESFKNCKDIVSEASGIDDIKLIPYTTYDAKMYDKPSVILKVPSNQNNFNVAVENKLIVNSETNVLDEIEVTPGLLESLFYRAIYDKRDPSALFFDSELDAIQTMASLIKYLKNSNTNSLWRKLKTSYLIDFENSHVGVKDNYIRMIKTYINSLKTFSTSSQKVNVEPGIFEELIDVYNTRVSSSERIDKTNVYYNLDLYGLLYEFVENDRGNTLFRSNVHPFYNFGNSLSYTDILRSTNSDGSLTDFGRLLIAQDINPGNNKLVDLLLDGLQFGIGLVTASIPLAFQVQISSLLMKLKKKTSTDTFGIKFVLCDYSLSMGVDFPLSSVFIIKRQRRRITISEKKQKTGRAGRSDEKGISLPSTAYYVNVENFEELETTDDILTFDLNDLTSYYYEPNQVYPALNSIIKSFDREFPPGRQIESSGLEKLRNSINFPDIDKFDTEIEKMKYMKQCLRELFDITRVIVPQISEDYIYPLFMAVQKQNYIFLMESI